MGQATLRAGRLSLAPLGAEHLDGAAEMDADPRVMRYLGPVRTRAEAAVVHRRRLADAARAPGFGYWAGLLGDEFVGWWILGAPEPGDHRRAGDEAELGYRLLRRYWRRGLAGEGSRELIRHGFDDLGLKRIYAQTMAVNEASRATMRSVGLGYVRTFDLEWDDPLPGSEHGEVEYALTREEWASTPERSRSGRADR